MEIFIQRSGCGKHIEKHVLAMHTPLSSADNDGNSERPWETGICSFSTTVGYIVRISFVWFVVPIYGVNGYIVGSFASMLIMTTIDILYLVYQTRMFLDLREWLLKPICLQLSYSRWHLLLEYLKNIIMDGCWLRTVMHLRLSGCIAFLS